MYQQRIIIVGGGIVGLSTAYALLKSGMQNVTVLEQATVDHQRAASHGLSRLLRFEYGADLHYSHMVQLSLERWKNLERVSRKALFTRTGMLVLGSEEDNFTRPSHHILRETGLATERLSRLACKQRFPQFNTRPYTIFTYSHDAGLLQASLCLQTLKDLIRQFGGKILEAHQVKQISHDSPRSIRIYVNNDQEYRADRVVLATGPWLHHLLGYMHLPIKLTRQYVLYFAHLPVSLYRLSAFPAFVADDLYGFPIHSTCTGRGPAWLKIASHAFGAPVNPDDVPSVDKRTIEPLVSEMRTLLPDLSQSMLAQVDACIYDVSPDEDFILDYVPGDPRIVFATGLSGHGFKFGPVLGELLSSLVCQTEPLVPMERFRLARFSHQLHVQHCPVA